MDTAAAIALNRFGLGARKGEGTRLGDPKQWLRGQLAQSPAIPEGLAGLPSAAKILSGLSPRKYEGRQLEFVREFRQAFVKGLSLRFAHAFATGADFHERLVWFWGNHFTIAISNARMLPWPLAYETEAIRPHVLGRFEDLLLAVARHPGMLAYLDNAVSIGPNSRAGRYSGRGLNENFARELLELHTIGVDGGYTQDDVIALAKLLTGWSVFRGPEVKGEDAFNFFPNRHEPGEKIILGERYGEGEAEGVRALKTLARHPRTARNIALKFARHFVAEQPSPAAVGRLEAVFRDTGGDLKALALAAIEEPEAWSPRQTKMRTPVEFLTAVIRGLNGAAPVEGRFLERLVQSARLMGQMPFMAGSPKGFSDEAKVWSGPDAMLERVEWAHAVADQIGSAARDPLAIARDLLGPLLSERTTTAIARAESPVRGLALFLASPEFQRR